MKKLVFVALPAGAAYGAWKYMETVQEGAVRRQNVPKLPSEKALKDIDRELSK